MGLGTKGFVPKRVVECVDLSGKRPFGTWAFFVWSQNMPPLSSNFYQQDRDSKLVLFQQFSCIRAVKWFSPLIDVITKTVFPSEKVLYRKVLEERNSDRFMGNSLFNRVGNVGGI